MKAENVSNTPISNKDKGSLKRLALAPTGKMVAQPVTTGSFSTLTSRRVLPFDTSSSRLKHSTMSPLSSTCRQSAMLNSLLPVTWQTETHSFTKSPTQEQSAWTDMWLCSPTSCAHCSSAKLTICSDSSKNLKPHTKSPPTQLGRKYYLLKKPPKRFTMKPQRAAGKTLLCLYHLCAARKSSQGRLLCTLLSREGSLSASSPLSHALSKLECRSNRSGPLPTAPLLRSSGFPSPARLLGRSNLLCGWKSSEHTPQRAAGICPRTSALSPVCQEGPQCGILRMPLD